MKRSLRNWITIVFAFALAVSVGVGLLLSKPNKVKAEEVQSAPITSVGNFDLNMIYGASVYGSSTAGQESAKGLRFGMTLPRAEYDQLVSSSSIVKFGIFIRPNIENYVYELNEMWLFGNGTQNAVYYWDDNVISNFENGAFRPLEENPTTGTPLHKGWNVEIYHVGDPHITIGEEKVYIYCFLVGFDGVTDATIRDFTCRGYLSVTNNGADTMYQLADYVNSSGTSIGGNATSQADLDTKEDGVTRSMAYVAQTVVEGNYTDAFKNLMSNYLTDDVKDKDTTYTVNYTLDGATVATKTLTGKICSQISGTSLLGSFENDWYTCTNNDITLTNRGNLETRQVYANGRTTITAEYATNHDFINGTYAKIDETNHQATCSGCVTKDALESHGGGTATCLAPKTCTICNSGYGSVDSSNHTGTASVYTNNGDNTNHKLSYSCCNATSIAAEACSGTGQTCIAKATCTKCKTAYGSTKAHSYTGDWEITDSQCGKKCVNGCGLASKDDHSASSTLSTDTSYHWNECSRGCGTDMNKASHSVGSSGTAATYWNAATCGTCKKTYGSVRESKTYTISKFESDAELYMSQGYKDEGLVWVRGMNGNGHDGTNCGLVWNRQVGGREWASMHFQRNGSFNWDLSDAMSISIWFQFVDYNSSWTYDWILFAVTDQSDNILHCVYAKKTGDWQQLVVDLKGISDKSKLTNVQVKISTCNGTTFKSEGGTSLRYDDLQVTAATTSTSWNTNWTMYGGFHFEETASDGYGFVETLDVSDPDDNYMFVPAGYSDNVYAGTGCLRVAPHSTDGTWISLSFKNGVNGSVNWDLTDCKQISFMIRIENTGDASKWTFDVGGTTKALTLTTSWQKVTVDITGNSLSSTTIGIWNSATLSARSAILIDEFLVLK